MHPRRSLAVATLLLVLAPGVGSAAGGELWKYAMSLEGPGGMAMPMGEVTACRSRSSSLKPGLRDNCKLESYQAGADKATFRAVCGPPEPMTLSGEMTRSGDTVSGTLRVEQGGQQMVMKQIARKVGTCANPID